MNLFKLSHWVKKSYLSRSGPNQRLDTPILLQMHASECGAACLGIVLGYFNHWVPLTVLRDKCEVSRDGSSAAGILRAAKSFGLVCKGFGVSADLLPNLKLPLIIFWQYSHFVVLEGIDDQYYYINDPALGKRRIPHEDFLKWYSNIALQFEQGKDFTPRNKQVNLITKLDALFKGTYADLVGILACAVFLAILLLAIPASLKIFIDNILTGQTNWLILILALLFSGILAYFLTLIKDRILHRISFRISVTGFDQG
ncbi:MAG: cysteine peptidase family C39 domain-containing protein, partial [Rhodobacteraceae bacterium]|nr:cysteine peptidase family C39 domain-containing protein [Paracoccaceae bacterium]